MQWAKDALEHGCRESAKDGGLVQDRYFKQARACANDLGLTISARCRMVVPEKPPAAEDNPFMQMIQRRREA